jgi:hypothetical protein
VNGANEAKVVLLRLYLHDSVWCSHCQEKLWPVRTLKVEPPDDRIVRLVALGMTKMACAR